MAKRCCYPELVQHERSLQREWRPYDRVAEYWHDYATASAPHYAAFLQTGIAAGAKPQSILDLACGSASVTEKLARIAPHVVGLDSSESMLARGRARCAAVHGIQLVQGDFRSFDLQQRFDAVVCASDSLNYVRNAGELKHVFHCVAHHLKPGGWFVFDTITSKGMRRLSGSFMHVNVKGDRFMVAFSYNAQDRTEESIAYFRSGFERHRRIPIDPADVALTASDTGLVMDDYFSFASVPGRWYVGARCFFVLKKLPLEESSSN